jgi:hypothetical protein
MNSTTSATSVDTFETATTSHHSFQICEKCHSEVPVRNWTLHSFGCRRSVKISNNNLSEADSTNANVKKQKFIDNETRNDQTSPIAHLSTIDSSLMYEVVEETHWLCFFCTRINSFQDVECRTCGMHGVDKDGFELPRPQKTLCLNDWN